jgi:di/tricarboxylate transporter
MDIHAWIAIALISTTPNLILGSELERLSGGERTLGMFEFTIMGGPISVAGIAYMAKEYSIAIEIATKDEEEQLMGRGINMAEVSLSPHSAFIDRHLIDLSFRGVFGLTVFAIWRRGKMIEKNIGTTPLKLGDALLLYGPIRNIRKIEESDDLVLLDRKRTEEDVRRAPIALLILAVALLPPILGWYPLAVSGLASALLMVATGCVSLQGAQKAIDFRILFLIIGTVPLGDALFQTGVAGKLATTLFPAGMGLGQFYVFGVLFAISALLSTTSNNAAAAVILAPVAYAAAESSGVDVSKAFLAVAYGASCAFILPFAHQCNLMVMGPGGYQTKDFVKVGAGLSIVMAATAVILLSL